METAHLTQAEWETLHHVFLLQNLSRPALEAFLADPRCTRLRCPRGTVVYSPTVYARSLGVILAGQLEVRKGQFIVNTLRPGELFGAAALFHTSGNYATTLTACTHASVLLFPQALVEDLFAQVPEAAMAYIRYLSGRVRFLSDKLDQLLAGCAEERLARYLMDRRQGAVVTLDCSLTGLAARLNVSRASLYRAFDTLEAAGAVSRRGRTVEILAEARLRALQAHTQPAPVSE